MKPIQQLLTVSIVLSTPSVSIAATFAPGTSEQDKIITKESRKVFSNAEEDPFNIGTGFSSPLGWVLWKSPGTTLCEVTSVSGPNPAFPGNSEEFGGDQFTPVFNPDTGKFTLVSPEEYAEWGLKTRLGIYSGDPESSDTRENGSAVMLSLRDSFSYFNANQEGFGLDYSSTDGDSSLKVKGALMVDFYLNPLYNRTGWGDSGNPYKFWFRTGVEIDRDDTATKPFDRTSYYLLTNFQANPDQSARLLGLKNLNNIFSPQFLQVGAAIDHDEFTGDNDLRWIVGWQPQFYLTKDQGILAETFGINRLMFYKKSSFGKLFKPLSSVNRTEKEKEDKEENKPSDWYSSIPMDIRLSGGSDTLVKAFTESDEADKALVEWKAGLFLGNSKYRARAGYFVEGASPLLDLGNTHLGQRFVFEIGLGNISESYAAKQKENLEKLKKSDDEYVNIQMPTTDLGAMTIFAEYRFGAPPPTYKKEEIFQVGTRIRF
jgi:hypothetical protein